MLLQCLVYLSYRVQELAGRRLALRDGGAREEGSRNICRGPGVPMRAWRRVGCSQARLARALYPLRSAQEKGRGACLWRSSSCCRYRCACAWEYACHTHACMCQARSEDAGGSFLRCFKSRPGIAPAVAWSVLLPEPGRSVAGARGVYSRAIAHR